MLIFRDQNGNMVAIPWHAINELRVVKRFPFAGDDISEVNDAAKRPVWMLLVNGTAIARYSDAEHAEQELELIAQAICTQRMYFLSDARQSSG